MVGLGWGGPTTLGTKGDSDDAIALPDSPALANLEDKLPMAVRGFCLFAILEKTK